MNLFRISGILETISTISLFFIAMPVKYIGGNEILVKIIGPIHGALFVLYIILVLWEQRQGRLNVELAIKGMLSAIPPGGPIWFERKLVRMALDNPE
jgi:integral membrane protein